MKVTFLGTNGWYSSPTGDTPCILIDSKDHYVVLDAGNGIYKLDKYITDDKPISLFISHFHIDHVSGLQVLPKFNFKQEIDVYVGAGRAEDFEAFVNPPFTQSYKKLKTPIKLYELSEKVEKVPFEACAIKQTHLFDDHGFRIELEGKIIAYTGDCALTDATRILAKNADLLISECANKENELPGHMNPIEAATLAKEEDVKQLILTHFPPTSYPTLKDRRWAETEAKNIFPNTTAATDGMEIEI